VHTFPVMSFRERRSTAAASGRGRCARGARFGGAERAAGAGNGRVEPRRGGAVRRARGSHRDDEPRRRGRGRADVGGVWRGRRGERELRGRAGDEGVPVVARDEIRRLSVEQGSGPDGRQDRGDEAGTKVPRSHEGAAVISSSRIVCGPAECGTTLFPRKSSVNAFVRRDAAFFHRRRRLHPGYGREAYGGLELIQVERVRQEHGHLSSSVGTERAVVASATADRDVAPHELVDPGREA